MYKIRYYYSSFSKQIMVGSLTLILILRFILFFAGGFYKEAYTLPTVVLYLTALATCVFLLIGWRFFYSEFDERTITKYNLITKKRIQLDLDPVCRARFSRAGISLFYEGDVHSRLSIPFYRLGIISPVGVENFMNLMKNHQVEVIQEYDILPGYGLLSRIVRRINFLLAAVLILSSFRYILLIYLIANAK